MKPGFDDNTFTIIFKAPALYCMVSSGRNALPAEPKELNGNIYYNKRITCTVGQVLLLNADAQPVSYLPLSAIQWKEAITYLWLDKVTCIRMV